MKKIGSSFLLFLPYCKSGFLASRITCLAKKPMVVRIPRGFTLIEVLIALTIFAILAAITSSIMYQTFNARNRINSETDRLNELQLTMALIRQDTEQIIARTIYANQFQYFPAFIGRPHYVEFTRGGIPNPHSAEKRSTLKRFALLCKHHQLIRRSWSALDPSSRQEFEDKVLLHHLEHCQFAFLTANLQLLSEWHKSNLPNEQNSEVIPKAIQLNLTLPTWGEGSFLFIIPIAAYAQT